MMKKISRGTAGLVVMLAVSIAYAATYSIPAEQIDNQKVFWGSAAGFEKPAEVNYQTLILATPEYKKLKQDKVERGTGKYWILISQASDRVVRIISQVGQESEYDLIAAAGYLGSLEPAIPADDITKIVLEAMNKSDKN